MTLSYRESAINLSVFSDNIFYPSMAKPKHLCHILCIIQVQHSGSWLEYCWKWHQITWFIFPCIDIGDLVDLHPALEIYWGYKESCSWQGFRQCFRNLVGRSAVIINKQKKKCFGVILESACLSVYWAAYRNIGNFVWQTSPKVMLLLYWNFVDTCTLIMYRSCSRHSFIPLHWKIGGILF